MIQTGNPVFEEDEGRLASPEVIPADGDLQTLASDISVPLV